MGIRVTPAPGGGSPSGGPFAPVSTTTLDLVDRTNNTTETVPAGTTTNCSTAGVTKTAPALDNPVATPPKRFAIKNLSTGTITVAYPDQAGNAQSLTMLAAETRTFRQKSTSGWGVESGALALSTLDGRFAPITGSAAYAPVLPLGVTSPPTALAAWKTALASAKSGSLVEVNLFGDSTTFGQTNGGSSAYSANNYSMQQKLRALSIAAGYPDGGVGIRGITDSASMNTIDAVDPHLQFTRTDTGCGVTSGSNVVTDTAILATDIGRKVTPSGGFAGAGYVGSVTPGVSFTVVTTQGGATALNATGNATTNMAFSGDGFNAGGFYGLLFNATASPANFTQTGFTTVLQGKQATCRLGYISQASGAASFTYSVNGGTATTVNTNTGTRTANYVTLANPSPGSLMQVTITVTVAGTLEVWGEWVNASGLVWHKQGLAGQQLAGRLPYASANSMQTAWAMGLGVGTAQGTQQLIYAANTGPRTVKLNVLIEGLNDMAQSTSQSDAINRAQAVTSAVGIFAELCRNAGVPGVVAIPHFAYFTNAQAYMGLFRAALQSGAAAYGLPTIDLQMPVGPITTSATYGASFGVNPHLNQAGYDAQANFLWNNLLAPTAAVT